jgi:hypothetical protein
VHALVLMLVLGARGALLAAGTPAPSIEARGAAGHAVGQDFDGGVTFVGFFATSNPRCAEVLLDYHRLKVELGERVRIVLVDVEEEPATVRAFFARHRLPLGAELALDRSGATARAWRVTTLPAGYLVDRHGVVRDAWSGWGDDSLRYVSEMIPFLENEDARRQAAAAAPDGDERARALGVEILH